MYIHNFYSDLLLAVRVLFDTHIFQNRGYIKRYEFNLGNRTLQLPTDYKPNFEFPNIIVTLNDDTPSYGQRPDVSQKIPGFNLDQIPVLYNQTTLEVLLVQEEMVNVPISCSINCESQFQAKEVAGVVKRWLPVNKFIQFLNFTSYLEVSQEFLSKTTFDPAIHTIANLYTKLNKKTGEIDYCYSLQYEPFIRLDSVTSSIPDSTQRSFAVSVDITFMIQQPVYMFSDITPSVTERINISIDPAGGFEPINQEPSGKMINYLSNDISNLKKGFVKRTFLVTDNDYTETFTVKDSVSLTVDQVTGTATGGRNIIVTKGSDDYLYITIGFSESRYRVKIDTIPIPDGVRITLSEDEYLLVTKDLAGNILVELYFIIKSITIKFNPTDFILTTDYSYNLVKGLTTSQDYTDYTLDIPNNKIIFNFSNSQFSTYQPSVISPLIVQFYLKDITFTRQVGGVQPRIGLVRVTNVSTSAAEITWISDQETTSQIEYSEESTVYNQSSVLDINFKYNHKVILNNLNSGLEYHFRINTVTANSEEYLSDDYVFTTLV